MTNEPASSQPAADPTADGFCQHGIYSHGTPECLPAAETACGCGHPVEHHDEGHCADCDGACPAPASSLVERLRKDADDCRDPDCFACPIKTEAAAEIERLIERLAFYIHGGAETRERAKRAEAEAKDQRSVTFDLAKERDDLRTALREITELDFAPGGILHQMGQAHGLFRQAKEIAASALAGTKEAKG